MEPTSDASVLSNSQKKEQQQKQKQKQSQPHTTKRQPLTTNERIEREEAKELAKQQAIINKHNKMMKKQSDRDNQNKKKNGNGTTKKRNTKDLPPQEATEILPHLFLGSALNAEDAVLARALRLSCVLNVAEELHAQVSAQEIATTQDATQGNTQDATTHEITTTMEEISITTQTTQDNTQCKRISLVVHDEVPEGKNQYATFEQAFLLIDEAKESNRPLLVHCMRGRSRSASIVIGYLMTRNNMTLQQSYDHVKKLRPFIGPHRRLRRQLIQYEQHVTGKSSIDPQAQFWGV